MRSKINKIDGWLESKLTTHWVNWDLSDEKERREAAEWFHRQLMAFYGWVSSQPEEAFGQPEEDFDPKIFDHYDEHSTSWAPPTLEQHESVLPDQLPADPGYTYARDHGLEDNFAQIYVRAHEEGLTT